MTFRNLRKAATYFGGIGTRANNGDVAYTLCTQHVDRECPSRVRKRPWRSKTLREPARHHPESYEIQEVNEKHEWLASIQHVALLVREAA